MHILENEALILEKNSLSGNGPFAAPECDPGSTLGGRGYIRSPLRKSMAIPWVSCRAVFSGGGAETV
jgi:hypothetical protein